MENSTLEKEIRFLVSLVNRCLNIEVRYITSPEDFVSAFSEDPFTNHKALSKIIDFYRGHVAPVTICSWISSKHLRYIILNFSSSDGVLILGPYLEDASDDELIYQILDSHHLSIDYFTRIKLYYDSLPLYDDSHISNVGTDIIKHLLGEDIIINYCQHDFSTIDTSENDYMHQSLEHSLSLDMIAKRYECEKELIQAVSWGNIEESTKALHELGKYYVTAMRTKDPQRNIKNSLITFNTLLRKAAEYGGVHPVYLDETSHKWAVRFENTHSSKELDEFQHKMLRSYCMLVKNHSLAGYSPIVRQAVDYINFNLASGLTVSGLADMLNISADYLTRLFRLELKCTVIEYINKQRITSAVKLLNTTHMPIQNIAMCIGINDTSYFGKLFKKQIGMSPRQYRESI
ncbi:MAG: AraC family transcriptional regulator [Lachnospiraceae bacterium]|nr:AraC family transcriptional regulator [Lachnospiraceae bacterium]MDD3616375.1 AraC family transcriptional regulator [Lachnospiraceae bacterium]